MTIERGKLTVLRADEGKLLTNGYTASTVVYLGSSDRIENWREVDEFAEPTQEDDDTLTLEILADHEYRLCLMELGVTEDDL